MVAARRRSPLTFGWPWLERRSVAAGQRSLNSLHGPCDFHSSRAFYSRPVVIVLSMMSACQIRRLIEYHIANNCDCLCCLYTWTWRYIQPAACIMAYPAANPAIASAVLLCYSLVHQTPPITHQWEEYGTQVMGAYFVRCLFLLGAYIREDLDRMEMSTYIIECLHSWGDYYPDSKVWNILPSTPRLLQH